MFGKRKKEPEVNWPIRLGNLARSVGASVLVTTNDIGWEKIEIIYKDQTKVYDAHGVMMFTGTPESFNKFCEYGHTWLIKESTRRTYAL